MSQNILIVWHIPSYGIGYFKNILSTFYTRRIILNQKVSVEEISQLELENGFSSSNGFLFDKVYYLYFSDETIGKISDRTKSAYVSGRAKVELLNDDIIKQSNTLKIWKEVFKMNWKSIKEEIKFVKDNYQEKQETFINQYWRNIHYYPIAQQIEWFECHSNASKIYGKDKVEFINFTTLYGIKDLRDEDSLTSSFANFLKKINIDKSEINYFFNSGLGTFEMQLALKNVTSDPIFKKLNISIFSIVDQKENTKVNYRFRDLKYTLKSISKIQSIPKQPTEKTKQKEYHDFKVYPNEFARIKFNEMSFITRCDSDSSKNDRYLQRLDGKFNRLVDVKLKELEKILPGNSFFKISRSTIIFKNKDNIHGWSKNYDEITLSVSYIPNNGHFLATKESEEDYKKSLVSKPVKFSVQPPYREGLKKWLDSN